MTSMKNKSHCTNFEQCLFLCIANHQITCFQLSCRQITTEKIPSQVTAYMVCPLHQCHIKNIPVMLWKYVCHATSRQVYHKFLIPFN